MADASIISITGPLITARVSGSFSLFEAVSAGKDSILGEVTRIANDVITIQVYEDTGGLAPGDSVIGSGAALSVPLGPGLLGGICDGLLRPLQDGDSDYISRGVVRERNETFSFEPLVKVGDEITQGQTWAKVKRPGGSVEQLLTVLPGVNGRISTILAAGDYKENKELCTVVDAQSQSTILTMLQSWPVRKPRPVIKRINSNKPLITGQRIIDSLFPIALGSKAAVPGGFGTGKTILLESLARWCSADVIVYVGCGERGNELTGMLEEFPKLQDPRTGRDLMERTVIIANASNMPVAAREASIYTGITVAEYFRDQGLHVALMADSTSRWAEALREMSGRLGEPPGEGGFPAYLASRLADFYERAAVAQVLNGSEGSVTIMATVSPPAGDFSEPVTSHTKRYVRGFWTLDSARAQARMYPAIDPLQSYSEDAAALEAWWQGEGNPHWMTMRRQMLSLLEEQVKLERMSRIIGKDALPPQQQLRLLCAELVNNSFLRQSAFSPTDRYTSPARQALMMSLLTRFTDLATQAIDNGIAVDTISSLPIVRRLQRMGEDLGEGREQDYETLSGELDKVFESYKHTSTAQVSAL